LPVDFPARPWPVSIITLKHRTLSPIVHRFIRCAEDICEGLGATTTLAQIAVVDVRSGSMVSKKGLRDAANRDSGG